MADRSSAFKDIHSLCAVNGVTLPGATPEDLPWAFGIEEIERYKPPRVETVTHVVTVSANAARETPIHTEIVCGTGVRSIATRSSHDASNHVNTIAASTYTSARPSCYPETTRFVSALPPGGMEGVGASVLSPRIWVVFIIPVYIFCWG